MPQDYEPIGFRVSAEDNASAVLDKILKQLQELKRLTASLNINFGGGGSNSTAANTARTLQQVAQSTQLWDKYNQLAAKGIENLTQKETSFVKAMNSVRVAQDNAAKSQLSLSNASNTTEIRKSNVENAALELQYLRSTGAETEKVLQQINKLYMARLQHENAIRSEQNSTTSLNNANIRLNNSLLTAQQRYRSLSNAVDSEEKQKEQNTQATIANTAAKKSNTSANNANAKSLLVTGIRLGALAMLARRLGNAFGKALNESGSYYENLNLFAVTFGETYKETLDWSLELAHNLGFASSEVVRFTGLFKQLSTAIEITSDTGDEMSKVLTSLGYDLASFYNITTESAFEKLQAGIFSGQTKPLRALGLDVTYQTLDNVLKTNEAFADLGVTSSKGLDQATKAMLRLLVVLQNSQNAWGDTTKTIESYENQIRVLQGSIANLKLAIGDTFRDIFANALVYINGFIQGITAIIRAFTPMEKEVDNVSAAMTQYADDTEEATTATEGGLADFDKFRTLGQSDSASQKDLKIQQAITDELNKQMNAYNEYLESLGEVSTKSQEIADKIRDFFITTDEEGLFTGWTEKGEKVKETLSSIAGIVLGLAGASGILKLINAVQSLSSAFSLIAAHPVVAVILAIGVAVGYLYATSRDFRKSVNSLFATVKQYLGKVVSVATKLLNILEPIFQIAVDVLTVLANIASWLFDKLTWLGEKLFSVFNDIIPDLDGVWSSIKSGWNSVTSSISSAWNNVWNTIKSGFENGEIDWDALYEDFEEGWEDFKTTIKTGWDNFWSNLGLSTDKWVEDIKEAFRKVKEFFLDIWGTIKNSTGGFFDSKFWVGNWFKSSPASASAASVQAYSIPKFAGGGITDANFIMTHENGVREWVGRQGSNTAVVNDTQMSEVMSAAVENGTYRALYSYMSQATTTSSSGTSGDIVLQVDGNTLFRIMNTQAKNRGYYFPKVR